MSTPNPIIVDAEVVLSEQLANAELQSNDLLVEAQSGSELRPMPHITIGEVETLPSGSEATATMTGTYANPVLNLGLVKGDRGEKGDKGDAGSLDSVTADIDPNVGTPSVIVDYDGGNAAFHFHNLKGSKGDTGVKGDKGDKGDTGNAAGFGTPTATVDSNVGTPSVVITASGPDTAKVFNFAFHNLKGQDGVGDVVSVNGQTGTVVLDAEDVGALPDDTAIPSKTSDLTNDSGYLTLATLPIWDGSVQ